MSSKVSQKEAVFQAIVNVTGHSEGKCSLSKEERKQVSNILLEGFKSGSVSLEKTYTTDAEYKGYINSLLSNWLRKDTRLNGGSKHEIKNPGSRSGSTDPQLKSLRSLLANISSSASSSEEEKSEIQGYIDARVAELNLAKPKSTIKKAIDFSVLPESLRAKFQTEA